MTEISVSQILTERRARLRGRLQAANIVEVARRSGLHHTTLWRIREGRVQPGEDTIDAVELALNYLREKGAV